MKNLYLSDNRPWIIGFSGGKDSTCVTQLTIQMLQSIPPEQRKKNIHILSSNTLVESPSVAKRIKNSCRKIDLFSKKEKLPISVKILHPELNDTFWVNLIGRGYPSPNKWFRWCTDRLKIRPMSNYIYNQVKENGEVIILLGARKNESASRAQTLGKYEIKDFKLRNHSTITGAFVYAPIEEWSAKEVWIYLLQSKSPWSDDNNELRFLYKQADGECPLVIDKSTPSCGSSRFGCWTCTVVDKDRALEGLIEDGQTWLQELLDFRNLLKEIRDDPNKREKYRKNEKKKEVISSYWNEEYEGSEHRGHKIMGPFTFETRHDLLKKLLALHEKFKKKGLTLISPEEIKAIETIWIYEGDEISSITDVLDDTKFDSNNELMRDELQILCDKYSVPYDIINRLLIVENDFTNFSKRKGIYSKLEKVLEEHTLNEIKKGAGGI